MRDATAGRTRYPEVCVDRVHDAIELIRPQLHLEGIHLTARLFHNGPVAIDDGATWNERAEGIEELTRQFVEARDHVCGTLQCLQVE